MTRLKVTRDGELVRVALVENADGKRPSVRAAVLLAPVDAVATAAALREVAATIIGGAAPEVAKLRRETLKTPSRRSRDAG